MSEPLHDPGKPGMADVVASIVVGLGLSAVIVGIGMMCMRAGIVRDWRLFMFGQLATYVGFKHWEYQRDRWLRQRLLGALRAIADGAIAAVPISRRALRDYEREVVK